MFVFYLWLNANRGLYQTFKRNLTDRRNRLLNPTVRMRAMGLKLSNVYHSIIDTANQSYTTIHHRPCDNEGDEDNTGQGTETQGSPEKRLKISEEKLSSLFCIKM